MTCYLQEDLKESRSSFSFHRSTQSSKIIYYIIMFNLLFVRPAIQQEDLKRIGLSFSFQKTIQSSKLIFSYRKATGSTVILCRLSLGPIFIVYPDKDFCLIKILNVVISYFQFGYAFLQIASSLYQLLKQKQNRSNNQRVYRFHNNLLRRLCLNRDVLSSYDNNKIIISYIYIFMEKDLNNLSADKIKMMTFMSEIWS